MYQTEDDATVEEILAELMDDDELSGSIANLNALYFDRLENHLINPMVSYRLGRARDALALAEEALKRLAECSNRFLMPSGLSSLSSDPNRCHPGNVL